MLAEVWKVRAAIDPDRKRAFEGLERAIEIERKYLAEDDPVLLRSRHQLGVLHLWSGNPEAAEEILRETSHRRSIVLPPLHIEIGYSRLALSTLLARKGEWDEALVLALDAADIFAKSLPRGSGIDQWMAADARSVAGEALVRLGRGDEGIAVLLRSAATLIQQLGPTDEHTLETRARLAQAYELLGHQERARCEREELATLGRATH